jgi:hypothetical protein
MHPLIRTPFALLLLCHASVSSLAGAGSTKPVSVISIQADQIQKLNSFLSSSMTILETVSAGEGNAAANSGKICSCQILDLESSNFHHQQVVLLAEKTIHGESSDYSLIRSRIQKEKKQLKKMFYDKVKVVSEIQGAGSCKSLYIRLKSADSNLQLYEILNADIY